MGGRRWIILTALAAALAAPRTVRAQAVTAPSTAPAVQLLDPAVVLTSKDATQADRDEAARRLVLRQSDEARTVLSGALTDAGNRPAQLAVARALASVPQPDPALINPLLTLIGKDAVVTDAAIGALAAYRDLPQVRSRLIDLAANGPRRQPVTTRKSAIRAVATMSDKQAAQTLVDLAASDAEPADIRVAAANALADFTALPGRDAPQWQQWWADNQNKPDADFERDILSARAARLARLEAHFPRVVREMQALLADDYQTASDARREVILLRCLRASEPETRAVGVQLIQDDFRNRRPIPQSARDELRQMVGDSSAQVRVLVAQALFLLNDPAALNVLLAQIKHEQDDDVRVALANALAPIRDLRVVPTLLDLLHDRSLSVAEIAANALRDLGPLIRTNPELAAKVARELEQALNQAGRVPGTAAFRAAIVEAMGGLKNPDLRSIYINLVKPAEPSIVRQAALRALGKFDQPDQSWAADVIIQSIDDQDDDVRMEVLNALDTTANITHGEKLYDVLKNPREKPEIRKRAWEVLAKRFVDAPTEQLTRWADRFRDPSEADRRLEILQTLAQRLTVAKDTATLAVVQQNIGEDLMILAASAARDGLDAQARAYAEEADKYFDQALQYYRSKNPNDQGMTTSALLEQRMDALLTSKQFGKAADFAAASIGINQANQEAVGRKLFNEVNRLRDSKQYPDAIALIDAVNKMQPPLADSFLQRIRSMETEIRSHATGQAPQSALGSGQ